MGGRVPLVHCMVAAGATYRARDRLLARTFSEAAEVADLQRIIYLGGLGETGGGLSEHLASRREVEAALRSGSVPVTVFRAAMIIGSGSASFEILRYLVERLPIMITPRWVSAESHRPGLGSKKPAHGMLPLLRGAWSRFGVEPLAADGPSRRMRHGVVVPHLDPRDERCPTQATGMVLAVRVAIGCSTATGVRPTRTHP